MTLDDLSSYSVPIRSVSQIDYRSFKVTSTTAPSSGIVAMSVLKALNTYDNFFAPDNVNLSTHRMDEAIPFGYGERANLGDPSFVKGMGQYQEDMLKQSTIDAIRGKISDFHTLNEQREEAELLQLPSRMSTWLMKDFLLWRPLLVLTFMINWCQIKFFFEYGYDNSTVKYMKQRGHNVIRTDPRLPDWSEAQAIRLLQNGTFEAAGEPRQSDDGGFAI
ncbi:hypothetical protein PENSOL_c019G01881 [Penicillium solitum]|uniref:Uncharacterized protein n=1 Tax=Penicillium solitum TaxID=60172 RepID=A0A1V6R2T6_9EURO|nr:uncharacterized protein PENSOL_c019G01881 [Penicillium solitum]OQD95745.1 hypothetical protein PENSOL_c019G01881 [Penicillium solitum]